MDVKAFYRNNLLVFLLIYKSDFSSIVREFVFRVVFQEIMNDFTTRCHYNLQSTVLCNSQFQRHTKIVE